MSRIHRLNPGSQSCHQRPAPEKQGIIREVTMLAGVHENKQAHKPTSRQEAGPATSTLPSEKRF